MRALYPISPRGIRDAGIFTNCCFIIDILTNLIPPVVAGRHDLLRDGLDIISILRSGVEQLRVDVLGQLAPRRRRGFHAELAQAQRHACGYHELAAADVVRRLVSIGP